MLLGNLGASLLGNLWTGKGLQELVQEIKKEKEFLKLVLQKIGIFITASSFNKLWNTKVLSKWTKI